jgi:hypothetical protein
MITNDLKDSSTLTQFRFEIAAWIRLVKFLNEENTYLKNRLSEVIDQIQDSENLALAEHFQNQFIIKDDVYDHVLYDLKKQLFKWRDAKSIHSNETCEELNKTQKNLRAQIEFIEREHVVITKDYNTYLSSLSLSKD